LDLTEAYGFTPLHLASYLGRHLVVKLYIEHGANVNTQNKSGSSPLHLASKNGNVEVVSMLIAAGASLISKDKKGQMPYSYAKNEQIKQMLVETATSQIQQLKSIIGSVF